MDLFVNGTDGYHTYRIPSLLVTVQGTVLAFCEGRKHGRGDSGEIDLVTKRSTDGGRTWSEIHVIWGDGENTCGNPCPVVEQETGTIWLLMTHNLGCDREQQIIDRTSKSTRTVWVTQSSDDGVTWAQPREITQATKRHDWTWYATGPGAGIQLRDGRLIIPCDHVEAGSRRGYSHVIYSDDQGETWQLGGRTPDDGVNECEVVELEDGTLLLNMRNYDSRNRHRAISSSNDQGESWSATWHDEALIEPMCQASIRRLALKDANHPSSILFSNPASKDTREGMTVRLTYDECKTWPIARQIHAGPAAYSCLAVLPDKTILCLYERGDRHPYEKISLARFNLNWLTG